MRSNIFCDDALPMEEIVGYDDHKFIDADTAVQMRESDLRVLLNGETIQNEEVNFNQLTGEANVFLSVKRPLQREDGSIYALCGIAIDISERKDIEEHMSRMAQYVAPLLSATDRPRRDHRCH